MGADKVAIHCGQCTRAVNEVATRTKRLVSRAFWRVRSIVTATISVSAASAGPEAPRYVPFAHVPYLLALSLAICPL
jgi:hypothetical protein